MVADPHIHDAEGGADRRRFHAHGVGAAGADLCGARPAAVPDRTGRDHADRIELHILDAHPVLRLSGGGQARSEEHTSELQSLMRISYAVFCLKKKKRPNAQHETTNTSYQNNVNELSTANKKTEQNERTQ